MASVRGTPALTRGSHDKPSAIASDNDVLQVPWDAAGFEIACQRHGSPRPAGSVGRRLWNRHVHVPVAHDDRHRRSDQ